MSLHAKVAVFLSLFLGVAACGTVGSGTKGQPSSSLPLVQLPPDRDQIDLVSDRVTCAREGRAMRACLADAGYRPLTETEGAAFVAAAAGGAPTRSLAFAVYRTDNGALLVGHSELYPRHDTSPIVLDGAGGRTCDGVARIVRSETADAVPLGDALLGCSDGTILSLRLTMDTPATGHGVGWDSSGRRYHVLFSTADFDDDRPRLSRALRMVGDAESPLADARAEQPSETFNLRQVRHKMVPVPRVYRATLVEPAGRRKPAFLRRMLPLIMASNEVIRAERAHMLPLLERRHAGKPLSPLNMTWLRRLAYRYEADWRDNPTLRYRVDTVPPSLALAQTVLETGWGRSRFAREGNAMFGEWTFGDSGGLVPNGRTAGATHRIRSFDTLLHSVMSYMDNLNTNQAYRTLRAERARSGALGRPATGIELARHLEHYAGDNEYIPKLLQVMRANALTYYDDTDLSPAVLQHAARPVPRPLPDVQVAAGPSDIGIGRAFRTLLKSFTGEADPDE